MTRFNNNNNNSNNNESSSSTKTTTTMMVTTDVASSSSSSSSTSTSSATTNIVTACATMATQSQSSSSTTMATIHAKTSTTTTMTMATTTATTTTTAMMIERPMVSLIGQPCGHHGPYTFYKAFRYCSNANPMDRVLMLGEFFFVRISPHDDPCIGELQLLWEDHQNHQLLSSTRLYFLPEQTPEGRLSHHGQHEVLAAQDKVILKLTDLVTWITHQVDWLAGMPYKWQPPPPTLTSCPSSTTSDDDDDPPLLLSETTTATTTTSYSSSSTIATTATVVGTKKLNENEDNAVAAENNGEKKNSSEKQATQQRKMLSSLAFIHNQNVIPPNGSVPFLTSQRFINDRCKILYNTPPPPPTTTSTAPPTTTVAAAQQNNGTTVAINDNYDNIDEATSTNTSVMDQPQHPATRQQPQRYCRSFACSRVDFSDIIPMKLRSNDLQDDLSNVVVLSYNKYCRFRNLLKRIEGREKDYLAGQPWVQDVLIELGIPQQRNVNVNILFCRDTFNHEALLNNDLNCDHLAPKLKGRPRKRPLKAIRASSPDSDSPEENGRPLFSPRRTRRTTAASTLASNLLNIQHLFDKRKRQKNSRTTTNNRNNKTAKNQQQRSDKNNNNNNNNTSSDQDQDQDDNRNCEDGGGLVMMVKKLNQNSNDENDDDDDHHHHHHHPRNHNHDDGQKAPIDKENKSSNNTNNNNGKMNGNMNGGNGNNNDNGGGGGGQHSNNDGAEGDDDDVDVDDDDDDDDNNNNNKTDSSTVDANNNIDKYEEQEQEQEEEDIIIVRDRKQDVAAKGAAIGAGGGAEAGGEAGGAAIAAVIAARKEYDAKSESKRFLKELTEFMKQRSTPIQRVPHLGFKKIDLYLFYTKAQGYGGYKQLTKTRQWKKLYDDMGGDKRSTSAATCTRRHYENLLLPFDRHLHGLPDTRLRRRRDEDLSDDVEDEFSSIFSETDTNSSKDNDSDARSFKSREEEATTKTTEAEQPMVADPDPDVIVTTAPPGTNTTTTNVIKGIQLSKSFNNQSLSETCDEKINDVKVEEKNDDGDVVVVNHFAVGGACDTPTDQEIDIKLIPLDSTLVECWKKKKGEKDMKLFRDISPAHTTTTTTATNARPTKTNAVLPIFSTNTNHSHQKMTALVHPTQRRVVLNNIDKNDATSAGGKVGGGAGDVYDFSDLNPLEHEQEQPKEELLLLKSFESNKKQVQQQQLLQQQQALKNVNNPDNKSRLKGPSPFHSIANLVNNNNDDRLMVVQQSPETVVVKQAEKPTTGGIPLSPIDDIGGSANFNPPAPPPTAATTTNTTMSANVKKKNILLPKSLENSGHHHHLHHHPPPTTTGYCPPTPIINNSGGGRRMVPLPAHRHDILQARATSFGTTKRKKFNIEPDEILDLSMKKRFHEADSRTIAMNVNSFPVDNNGGGGLLSTTNHQQQQQSNNNNNVRDGILLDLSITTTNNNNQNNSQKNNKLNSTTKQPKLPITQHQVFVQENPCSITTAAAAVEPSNLICRKNSIQLPKEVVGQRPKQPSIISLNGEEMIVKPVDAPQKARSYKALPRQIRPKPPNKTVAAAAAANHCNNNNNNNQTSVIQPSLPPSLQQPIPPSISEYNPSLPQFIGSHLWNNWNPFQMQTAAAAAATTPTPFPSGVVPIIPPPTTPPTNTTATTTTNNSVHHHHHTSPPKSTPPPPQLSFNNAAAAAAAVHSNIPAIIPQSILSSFPNYDTRSSSSSSSSSAAAITNNNSPPLDRNSLALLEQIRMFQAFQLNKNNFQGQNPFLTPDVLASYNLANILASSISTAAASSSPK